MKPHHRSVFLGLLFLLPFAVMNLIVALKLEPMYSSLGAVDFIAGSPWLVIVLIFLILIGAYVALRPAVQKDTNGKRNWYVLNLLVATALFCIFGFLFTVLGEEIYRCDVLQIPNCD